MAFKMFINNKYSKWYDYDVTTEYESHFIYDNLGNCTNFDGTPLQWSRGNLLTKFGSNINYSYNTQGVRFKKVLPDKSIQYYYGGTMLLREHQSDGNIIRFIYDAEGIIGFQHSSDHRPYCYLKDTMGNVISIFNDNDGEIVRYSYDPRGNCTIKKDTEVSIGSSLKVLIGKLNSIRWKSQYYDTEGKFYYINCRNYSPFMKQFLNPSNFEKIFYNKDVLGGLNHYAIVNPMSFEVNGHNIFAGIPLDVIDSSNGPSWL